MKFQISNFKSQILLAALGLLVVDLTAQPAPAASSSAVGSAAERVYPLDLAAALRLAGAQNLDVLIARQKLEEAKANYLGARLQFFPWLTPGAAYRRHEARTQDVVGNLLNTDKQAYALGASVTAQWDLGDAIYKALATRQLTEAAGHALEAQRQESVLAAANGYFDLLLAQGLVGVAEEAVRISQDYQNQVRQAVEIGVAFKGDELRVQVQTERNRLTQRQAAEQSRVAAARLAQTLHLDPKVELKAAEAELIPMSLVDTNAALDSLMQTAFVNRPDLKQSQALISAAKESRDGAVYGPWIPSVGAQAFVGGLGGGLRDRFGDFEPSRDLTVGLGWRIGPGGLFDSSRTQAAAARFRAATLNQAKAQDETAQQVVSAFTHFVSAREQIETAERALRAAEMSLRLSRERKQFAVGIVLETIQAEQDLTRSRSEYLRAVAEFNKGQYALSKTIGKL